MERAGDEDGKNAEFDEREYLDVLTAAGYEFVAVRSDDGGFFYWRKESRRRLTPAHEKVFAQMQKRCDASQADARIAAECVRRGLIG